MRHTIRSLAVLSGVLATPAVALAQPVLGEGNDDHHHPPPEYAAPGWDMPPSSAAAPEYPLAAQFVEADASNYTAGGIAEVQYVVVHTMQGSYAGSINWFQNPSSDVSAHFCMRSSDGEITQMVRLGDRAWHVGNSNSYAIGIEHEGFVDDASWYTFAMYARSAELARWLADRHGLPLDREHIVGHVELPNQTHTDPGNNWDWDLYMALVHDVVGENRIEGIVVDRGRACTLTANTDTFLKATIEDAGALGDDAKCAVPAGTAFDYVHADGEIHGHWRLALEGDGPCAANGALAEQAFGYAAHFDAVCGDEAVAAPGATVALDGGEPVAVGADGRFVFTDVGAGAHTIDASAPASIATQVAIDHAGYPGTRIVVRLDPIEQPGDTSTDGTDASEDEGEADGAATDPDPTDPDGGASGGGDPTGPGGADDDALPDTFGEREVEQGCACAAEQPGRSAGGLAFAGLLLLGARARRHRGRAPARASAT